MNHLHCQLKHHFKERTMDPNQLFRDSAPWGWWGGWYCHNLFPVLSPSHHIHPVPLRLTPFLSYHAPQVTPINPDYAQPGPMHLFQSHLKSWPEPQLEHTPTASGMWSPSKVMWPSHDNHATMCHPHHFIGRPLSWWTWDLRVPTLFLFNLF